MANDTVFVYVDTSTNESVELVGIGPKKVASHAETVRDGAIQAGKTPPHWSMSPGSLQLRKQVEPTRPQAPSEADRIAALERELAELRAAKAQPAK